MSKPLDLTTITSKLEPLTRLFGGPVTPHQLDDAVVLLRTIHECLMSIEEFRIWMKWCLGLVVNNTKSEFGSKDDLISELSRRLSDEHAIRASKSNLYECQRVCRIFNNDTLAFGRWMEEMKFILGRGLFWSDVQDALLGGRSNPRVIGRESADQRDYRLAEEGIDALERILIRASEGDEEAQGVIEGARQTIVGWSLHTQQVPTIPRSDEYLRFVRRFGCLVCEGPAEAHHAFGFHPLSDKSSDFTSIPLCAVHHRELHRRGRSTFERMHELKFVDTAYNLLHFYHTGVWASLKLTPFSA